MYLFEERPCNIVRTFQGPGSNSAAGELCPPCPAPVTPLLRTTSSAQVCFYGTLPRVCYFLHGAATRTPFIFVLTECKSDSAAVDQQASFSSCRVSERNCDKTSQCHIICTDRLMTVDAMLMANSVDFHKSP